jgi:hypothetical protein
MQVVLLEGWNYGEHVWRFKKLEVCAVCHDYFRITMNNALCEAERQVHAELREVMQTIYENMW